MEASKILNIKGNVFPVTLDNVRLHALLSDGREIKGESKIDGSVIALRSKIAKIWLNPSARINPLITIYLLRSLISPKRGVFW